MARREGRDVDCHSPFNVKRAKSILRRLFFLAPRIPWRYVNTPKSILRRFGIAGASGKQLGA